MKIIAVTRIRNEDDLVESFCRHHACLVDHHIFLDNGSNDNTLLILQNLKKEGLNITIFSDQSSTFTEVSQNTFLLYKAVDFGADWIVYLDCDEFIDPVSLEGSLHSVLSTLPEKAPSAQMRMVNYHPTSEDDVKEIIVPLRQTMRDPDPSNNFKIIVRASIVNLGIIVNSGNHQASLNSVNIPAFQDPRLLIAHFYMRSGWQVIAKSLVATMKVYASGKKKIKEDFPVHYNHIFENIRDNPQWLLYDEEFMFGTRKPSFYNSINFPLKYLGGNVLYTKSSDPQLKAIRSITSCIEVISRRHGELVDSSTLTQKMAEDWANQFTAI